MALQGFTRLDRGCYEFRSKSLIEMVLRRRIVFIEFGRTQRFKRGSLQSYEIEVADDRHGQVAGHGRSIHSRRFYQRALEHTSGARATTPLQCRPVMADAF